jgi:hypothetical protein
MKVKTWIFPFHAPQKSPSLDTPCSAQDPYSQTASSTNSSHPVCGSLSASIHPALQAQYESVPEVVSTQNNLITFEVGHMLVNLSDQQPTFF